VFPANGSLCGKVGGVASIQILGYMAADRLSAGLRVKSLSCCVVGVVRRGCRRVGWVVCGGNDKGASWG